MSLKNLAMLIDEFLSTVGVNARNSSASLLDPGRTQIGRLGIQRGTFGQEGNYVIFPPR
jgi:hypothetical protein